jgi:hypothetical protein
MNKELFYPLDDFAYEQAKLKNLFYTRHPKVLIPKFAHMASSKISQEFLQEFFPVLTASIKKILHFEDRFFGRFFATMPRSSGDIHVDLIKDTFPIIARNWTLNLPIENCSMTYHQWYDTGLDPYTEIFWKATIWRNYDKGRLIDQLELTKPTILKVSIPHRISNPGDLHRIILAIRTESDSFNHL